MRHADRWNGGREAMWTRTGRVMTGSGGDPDQIDGEVTIRIGGVWTWWMCRGG